MYVFFVLVCDRLSWVGRCAAVVPLGKSSEQGVLHFLFFGPVLHFSFGGHLEVAVLVSLWSTCHLLCKLGLGRHLELLLSLDVSQSDLLLELRRRVLVWIILEKHISSEQPRNTKQLFGLQDLPRLLCVTELGIRTNQVIKVEVLPNLP